MKKVKLFLVSITVLFMIILPSACTQNEEDNVNVPVETIKTTDKLDLSGSEIDDISKLCEMTDLKKLDLQETNLSYEDIRTIQVALSECEVIFSIVINDILYPSNIDFLDISGCRVTDIDSLINDIGMFTQLDEVKLDNSNITSDDYWKLVESFENIHFPIDIKINNKVFSNDDSIIDLSDIDKIDVDEINKNLGFFRKVDEVIFGDMVLSCDDMDKLMSAYPDTDFVWNVELLDGTIAFDDSEIDISGQEIEDFEAFSKNLKYLSKVTYIDMCNCGLSNDEMDKLINTYPDIKFVWMIRIGNWEMRTDVKAFSTGNRYSFDGGRYLGGGWLLYDEDVADLKYCTDLVALDIGHQAYVYDFSFLEYTTKLEYLIIAMTGVKDISVLSGLKDLIYLEVFNSDVNDLSPLLELPNLKHLNISLTQFTGTDVLLQMKQLERLWIVVTPLTNEEIDLLRKEMPDTTIVHYTSSPTNGGWRAEDAQVYIDMQELFNLQPLFSE